MSPRFHDCILGEAYVRDQLAPALVKVHGRNKDVEVRVEVQVAAEGVTDHEHHDARAVVLFSPIFKNARTYGGEIVEQSPIPLKDRPEVTMHREVDAGKRNVWKSGRKLSLPSEGGALTATWTGSGFAGVRE
jgi:hypothetical protein